MWDVSALLASVAAAHPMHGSEGGLFAGHQGSPSSLVGRGAHRRPRAAQGAVELSVAPVWQALRHQNGVNGVSLIEDAWQQGGDKAGKARQPRLLLTVGDDQCIKTVELELGLRAEGGLEVTCGDREGEGGREGAGAEGVHGSTIRGWCRLTHVCHADASGRLSRCSVLHAPCPKLARPPLGGWPLCRGAWHGASTSQCLLWPRVSCFALSEQRNNRRATQNVSLTVLLVVVAGHCIDGDVLLTVGADQRVRAWRQVASC